MLHENGDKKGRAEDRGRRTHTSTQNKKLTCATTGSGTDIFELMYASISGFRSSTSLLKSRSIASRRAVASGAAGAAGDVGAIVWTSVVFGVPFSRVSAAGATTTCAENDGSKTASTSATVREDAASGTAIATTPTGDDSSVVFICGGSVLQTAERATVDLSYRRQASTVQCAANRASGGPESSKASATRDHSRQANAKSVDSLGNAFPCGFSALELRESASNRRCERKPQRREAAARRPATHKRGTANNNVRRLVRGGRTSGRGELSAPGGQAGRRMSLARLAPRYLSASTDPSIQRFLWENSSGVESESMCIRGTMQLRRSGTVRSPKGGREGGEKRGEWWMSPDVRSIGFRSLGLPGYQAR